jgi:GTP pyrophosphokinase
VARRPLSFDAREDPDDVFRRDFGEEIVRLVLDVTRLDTHPELATAVGNDVLFLKLADRLHNLNTIRALTREKQVQKATQTLQLLVPVADSMGREDLARLLGAAAHRTLASETTPSAPPPSTGNGLLRTAALLLPSRARTRWLGEWQAELFALPTRGERWRFAVDVALGCPRLAMVLRRRGARRAM